MNYCAESFRKAVGADRTLLIAEIEEEDGITLNVMAYADKDVITVKAEVAAVLCMLVKAMSVVLTANTDLELAFVHKATGKRVPLPAINAIVTS
jgi:hypothetical protein